MLTEIGGNWTDVGTIVHIVPSDNNTSLVWFIGDGGDQGTRIEMPAPELAALVNDVKANRFVKQLGIPEKPGPSDATLGRLQVLRDLLEEMDSYDNPDAAVCWKALRSHMKFLLKIAKGMAAGQAPSLAPAKVAPDAEVHVTAKGQAALYHQGQQDALVATRARCKLLAELVDEGQVKDVDAWGRVATWLDERIGQEPDKPFSERPIFSPKQLEAAKHQAKLLDINWTMWALRTEMEDSTTESAVARFIVWLEKRRDDVGAKLHAHQAADAKVCLHCGGTGHLPSIGMPADRLPGTWFKCSHCDGTKIQPQEGGV